MRREGEPPFLFFVDTTQRSIVRHTDLETLVNDYDIASLEKACNLIRECALGASRQEEPAFEELRRGEAPLLGRSNLFRLIALSNEFDVYMKGMGVSPEKKLSKIIEAVEGYIDSVPQGRKRRESEVPRTELAVLNSIMHMLGGGYIERYRSLSD